MRAIALLFLLGLSATAMAQVRVTGTWVRATVAHQTSSAAYMQLTSPRNARLIEVRSPVAGAVEFHTMTMDQGVMRMRAMAGVELPAGRAVELKPGGNHVMLMGLKRQLKAGESVPLTLVIQGSDGKRESIEVKAPVRPLNAADHGHQGH